MINKINITPLDISRSPNWGVYIQKCAQYTYNGYYTAHDSTRFDAGADLPGQGISVKSYHFTLASGTINPGDTLQDKLDNYFSREVASQTLYVMKDFTGYLMDSATFRRFCELFTTLERDSTGGNGGQVKVRAMRCESKMKKWFESQL